MSALLIMAVGALWFLVGLAVWKGLMRRLFVQKTVIRWMALAVFLAAWLVGPWVDEILGVAAFKRLCDGLPPIAFFGPVSVGPGIFFDDFGHPRFAAHDDLSSSTGPFGAEFDRLFQSRREWKRVSSFPIPVFDNPTTYYDTRNDRPVLTIPYRASPGGWLRRVTGFGSDAPSVCPRRGTLPRTAQWIRFDRSNPGG